MRPQASNHLGLEAQGSRWLPRGQGQGLSVSEAGLSEEGPWDHMSRAKGRLHPRRGRGPRGSCFRPEPGCGPCRLWTLQAVAQSSHSDLVTGGVNRRWLPRPSLGIPDSCFFLAGPGEAVPEGFQRGCVLWGWRRLLPVQRVCALPGGAATTAHPHRCPDKAGAPGLGPASVPTSGPWPWGRLGTCGQCWGVLPIPASRSS